MLQLILLAVALSLDSLVAGVAYGLQGIRVPLRSLAAMAGVSTLALGLSMGIGRAAGALISPLLARLLGALLLIGIGGYILLKSWLEVGRASGRRDGSLAAIRLASLGLVVQILRDPAAADVDRSGDLTVAEATTLGLAMAIDAFGAGAGIGISTRGWLPWLLPALVGGGAAGLLAAGHVAGRYGVRQELRGRVAYLPGCILVALGLLQLTCR
ncbi:MAG: sporulation membrane protein YtaF [Chloroflexota bacterium]